MLACGQPCALLAELACQSPVCLFASALQVPYRFPSVDGWRLVRLEEDVTSMSGCAVHLFPLCTVCEFRNGYHQHVAGPRFRTLGTLVDKTIARGDEMGVKVKSLL